MHHYQRMHSDNEARLITPCDLIGAGEAAAMLNVSKPTLTRRIAAGTLKPLARLEGSTGAFVFDRNDIQAMAVPA
ncbi:helix-turn-helix DNA binding domain protein [Arthrobacter phage Berka]|nr:helix-turn-helix DNA binding domain protein [Arthrobacter phage Berka]